MIAYWSLGVDVFMTTVKGAVGWMLNSTAIIADISFCSFFHGSFLTRSRCTFPFFNGCRSRDARMCADLSSSSQQEVDFWIRKD